MFSNIYLVERIDSNGERISYDNSFDAFVIQASNEKNALYMANFRESSVRITNVGVAVSSEESIILDSYNGE